MRKRDQSSDEEFNLKKLLYCARSLAGNMKSRAASRIERVFSPPSRPIASGNLKSGVYPLRIPLSTGPSSGWKPYQLFSGGTSGAEAFSCHASALDNSVRPHPPHRHREEELLLLLAGEVDLFLPDSMPNNTATSLTLKPGQFVYYPAGFAHTLQTSSDIAANYLMFKWHGTGAETGKTLSFDRFDMPISPGDAEPEGKGFQPQLVFSGKTVYLKTLQCHVSTLSPGAGYAPHADAYDVAVVVLKGEVETLGVRAKPYDTIYYAAGEPHGMRNPGSSAALYVVFEFHGS